MFRRINGASPTPPQTLLESPQISVSNSTDRRVAPNRSTNASAHTPYPPFPARKQPRRRSSVGTALDRPKIRAADLDIHALFTDYHPSPVFVIVDGADVGGHPHLRLSRGE